MTGLRPFLHVSRALSSRWFVRRWHADREFYAWRGRRAHAGGSVRAGCWLVQAALLEPRRRRP
jgi:hypothetical protein